MYSTCMRTYGESRVDDSYLYKKGQTSANNVDRRKKRQLQKMYLCVIDERNESYEYKKSPSELQMSQNIQQVLYFESHKNGGAVWGGENMSAT